MSIGMCFNDDVPWLGQFYNEYSKKHKDNISNSIIEIFDWCDELGVVMSFGCSKQHDEYFINLHKDKWFKTVYVSREILNQGAVPIYELVLDAVKELNEV